MKVLTYCPAIGILSAPDGFMARGFASQSNPGVYHISTVTLAVTPPIRDLIAQERYELLEVVQ